MDIKFKFYGEYILWILRNLIVLHRYFGYKFAVFVAENSIISCSESSL